MKLANDMVSWSLLMILKDFLRWLISIVFKRLHAASKLGKGEDDLLPILLSLKDFSLCTGTFSY